MSSHRYKQPRNSTQPMYTSSVAQYTDAGSAVAYPPSQTQQYGYGNTQRTAPRYIASYNYAQQPSAEQQAFRHPQTYSQLQNQHPEPGAWVRSSNYQVTSTNPQYAQDEDGVESDDEEDDEEDGEDYQTSPSSSDGVVLMSRTSTTSSDESSGMPKSKEPKLYPCLYRGCPNPLFKREADRQRHIDIVHKTPELVDCPLYGHRRCKRAPGKGFTRLDKLYEHISKVHDMKAPKKPSGQKNVQLRWNANTRQLDWVIR